MFFSTNTRIKVHWQCCFPEVETAEVKQARELEVAGVEAADRGDLDAALTFFNRAVEVAPNRAAAYNNRAQCRQLKMDVDGETSHSDSHFGGVIHIFY